MATVYISLDGLSQATIAGKTYYGSGSFSTTSNATITNVRRNGATVDWSYVKIEIRKNSFSGSLVNSWNLGNNDHTITYRGYDLYVTLSYVGSSNTTTFMVRCTIDIGKIKVKDSATSTTHTIEQDDGYVTIETTGYLTITALYWTDGTSFTPTSSVDALVVVNGTNANSWYLSTGDYTLSAAKGGERRVTVSATKPSSYLVRYEANYTGSSAYKSYEVQEGTSHTVISCPWTRAGYELSYWCTNSSGTGGRYYPGNTVGSSITLYAIWTLKEYTINANASPTAGGTVSVVNINTNTVTSVFTKGQQAKLTATPNRDNGYKFVRWEWSTPDGDYTSTSNPHTYTVNATDGDTDFTALFEKKPYITVQASPADGGTVTGGGYYDVGTSVTIKATANTLYEFVEWQYLDYSGKPATSTSSSLAIEVTGNKTYTAIFQSLLIPVNVDIRSGSGSVWLTDSSGNKVTTLNVVKGSTITLRASPASGYKLEDWYINEGSTWRRAGSTPSLGIGQVTYNVTIPTTESERTYYALFEQTGFTWNPVGIYDQDYISTNQPTTNITADKWNELCGWIKTIWSTFEYTPAEPDDVITEALFRHVRNGIDNCSGHGALPDLTYLDNGDKTCYAYYFRGDASLETAINKAIDYYYGVE